jgi:membrane protein implicated in regulation of membrane protease activity
MRLTRKGMNNECYDRSLSLKKRWKYSRELALWMNEQEETNEKITALKEKTEQYFNFLKKEKIDENYVHEFSQKKQLSFTQNYFVIIAGFPLFLIGLIHGALSYFWFKSFVEKSFKRSVFWSSVKMVGGLFIAGVYNLLFLFLFHAFVYSSWWLAIAYYLIVPGVSFLVMHAWLKNLKEIKSKKSCLSKDFESLVNKRAELLKEIHEVIPVA